MRAVGLPASLMIIVFYIMSNAASVGSNFWLSDWSMDSVIANINNTGNETVPVDIAKTKMRLGVYGVLGLAQGMFL
jgi:hypothetical protein